MVAGPPGDPLTSGDALAEELVAVGIVGRADVPAVRVVRTERAGAGRGRIATADRARGVLVGFRHHDSRSSSGAAAGTQRLRIAYRASDQRKSVPGRVGSSVTRSGTPWPVRVSRTVWMTLRTYCGDRPSAVPIC